MSKARQGWVYPARYKTHKHKRLGLFGAAFAFISMPLFAQQATLSVGSASAVAGSSVAVGISIADSGGIEPASLQWSLAYPTADITSVSVSAGSAATAASKTVSCNPGSGTITCVLYGLNFGVISPGTVANVSFHVNSAAPDAKVPIQISSVSIAGVDGSVIQGTGTGGTLSVSKSGPPPPPPPPPAIQLSSLSCAPTSVASGGVSTCAVGMTGATKSNTAVSLSRSSGLITIPSSVTVPTGSSSASFKATAGTISTAQTVTITASSGGVSKAFALSLVTGKPASSISIWSSSVIPGTVNDSDSTATEVGVKFRSDVAGKVTAIRFYKGSQNTGTHVGHLWTKGGTPLATVNFTNETGSGWQQANLSSPVSIQANTTYIVSYYAPSGHYSSDEGFFRSAVNSSTLHALQDGADGGNGVYVYGRSGFPNQSWHSSNYWVDVVFSTGAGSTATPAPGTAASSVSIWGPQAVPGTITASDQNAVELGTKFRSDVAGQITALRFYKGPQNTGVHVGHLWTASGTLLATVNFTNESGAGWQQADLSAPVNIQPNTTYVVSYYAPNGNYSTDKDFFASAVNSGSLHALQDGAQGPNGLFTYGADRFPNQSWYASNYWVDVVVRAAR